MSQCSENCLQALEGSVTTSPAPANEMCTEPVGSAPSRPAMITDARVWGAGGEMHVIRAIGTEPTHGQQLPRRDPRSYGLNFAPQIHTVKS